MWFPGFALHVFLVRQRGWECGENLKAHLGCVVPVHSICGSLHRLTRFPPFLGDHQELDHQNWPELDGHVSCLFLGLSVATAAVALQACGKHLPISSQSPGLKLVGSRTAIRTATSNLLTYRQTSFRGPEKLRL